MRLLRWLLLRIRTLLSLVSSDGWYRFYGCLGRAACWSGVLPYQKETKANLQRAFPDRLPSELRQIEKSYYQRACEFAAEVVTTFVHREAPSPRVRFVNLECLKEALRYTDFAVCYSGHFLNYEVLTHLPQHLEGVEMHCYYHPKGLRAVDRFVEGVRSRHGAKFIPTTSPLKALLSLRQETASGAKKYVIGSLADLKPQGSEAHHAPLFGKYVPAYCGTERVGRKLGAAFFYAKMLRTGRGCYEVELCPLVPSGTPRSEYPVTDMYFRQLEENIRQQPELWMLWATSRLESL